MEKIALVLVLAALASGQNEDQLRSVLEPEKSYWSIYPMNENGDNVGRLILRSRNANNTIVVNSHLEGLPPGQYFGVLHEREDFNGSCNMMSSPTTVMGNDDVFRRWIVFGVINVDKDNYRVTMDDNEKNAVKDEHSILGNYPVYIYPVPSNIKTRINETIIPYNSPVPRPVACGVISRMDFEDPERPKYAIIDANEARYHLSYIIENILALISMNVQQIVTEILTVMRLAKIATD